VHILLDPVVLRRAPGDVAAGCGALLAMGMAALSAPTAAQGQALAVGSDAEQAARALPSDNVYTAPDAERGLNGSEERRLQRAIAAADGGPVYVAVVPAAAVGEAGGKVGALARQIGTSVRRPGTYVVVAGDQIGAASSVLRPGTARELADKTAAANSGGGPASVLEDFIRRLGEARRSGGRVGDDRGGGGRGSLGLLAAIGTVVVAAVGLSRRRRRREERARVAEVKETAWDDLVAPGTKSAPPSSTSTCRTLPRMPRSTTDTPLRATSAPSAPTNRRGDPTTSRR
jgi:hypothetical protein